MQIINTIQNKIYTLRGERVMLDFDLAELYDVQTKVLNQAVKRNITRFPSDFMFQLNELEWQNIWSQFVTSSSNYNDNHTINSSQIVTSSPSSQFVTMDFQKNRPGKSLPYAFTEQGVAMLSGVLRSEKAIAMNIAIMRAFVEIRKILLQENNIMEQIKLLKERIGEHDTQLNSIYDSIENLLDEKASEKRWENRERIGFNK
jgi:phage regulator Rha-like protein